jgi:hypothetical protein
MQRRHGYASPNVSQNASFPIFGDPQGRVKSARGSGIRWTRSERYQVKGRITTEQSNRSRFLSLLSNNSNFQTLLSPGCTKGTLHNLSGDGPDTVTTTLCTLCNFALSFPKLSESSLVSPWIRDVKKYNFAFNSHPECSTRDANFGDRRTGSASQASWSLQFLPD